jgi:RNA polymerase sigma-70 factor (ECF subfamily)
MSIGDAEPTEHSADGLTLEEALSTVGGELPQGLGPLLERYRPYLLAIAQQETPQQLAGKVGASDLVQDAIVKGYEQFQSFEGTSREQLACWLRQILLNHVRNVAKAYGAEKRDVAREQPVNSRMVQKGGPSPSREFMSRERQESFQSALLRLPEELRRVIELRHRENLSFGEIGRLLAKSEDTARRLWARAIRQLQVELVHDESQAN